MYVNICKYMYHICILYYINIYVYVYMYIYNNINIYTDILIYFNKSMQLFLFFFLSINYITPIMDIL